MSSLAKADSFFKKVNLTSDDEVFVGVDVHKKSYHVALFLNDMPAIRAILRFDWLILICPV